MSGSVYMTAPSSWGGTITDTPSGSNYMINAGGVIQVQSQDVDVLTKNGFAVVSAASGVNTLVTGGGSNQATAVQLGYGYCPIASGTGFVALPAAVPGAVCILVPTDGTVPGVYAKNGTTDVVNASVHTALYDMATPPAVSVFTCSVAGHWRSNCAED